MFFRGIVAYVHSALSHIRYNSFAISITQIVIFNHVTICLSSLTLTLREFNCTLSHIYFFRFYKYGNFVSGFW